MTEREKQIAEIEKDITDNLFNGGVYQLAEALYKTGYRKIGENEIVVDKEFIGENFISKKALVAGQNCPSAIKALLTAEKVICEAKQETAEEIFQTLYDFFKTIGEDYFKGEIRLFAEHYGVEVEE